MSSISALLNVASSSHSSNEHDLPSLTTLSTALLNYSASEYPTRYSDSPPSYSPAHSRESNSPPSSHAYYSSYSSASSSYLPTPASSVRNLPLSATGSPAYTADNSFSYPSPRSETATAGPSYLAQGTESLCYPYSMSRASAPMMSQPPSPALPVSAPLQQPTPPQHQQSWSSMPPPPPPGQMDDKEMAKPDVSSAPASPGASATGSAPATTAAQKAKKKHVCQTCSRPFSTSGHLARHTRVHTGERNHKCPFPGCETRCSRQDNLQQHYRIHLSPKSRRTSNSAATRAAIARAIESAVHEDLTNTGLHATHPPAHPHPYPSPYPPPHYAPAAPYGAYPQYPPPNGQAVHPGQPQFMPAPGQPMHYPYPPPMTYAYPPPAPGQVPVQGAPPQAPPPGHHVPAHGGHHPQYAPYPPQRPPSGLGYPTQPGQQTQMGAPVQSAATSRAASTSGSNSPVQQSPRNTQGSALPAPNALGLQSTVPPGSAKPNQGWHVDQHGQPIGPDGRPQYAHGAYAYPSPYSNETGQPLPNTMPPNQRQRPGAGMPSPQSPVGAMNTNASGPPTPSAYAPQQVIQLEPTAQGQQVDGRSPRPTLPPIYRSPQVATNQYPGNVPQQGAQVPQGKMPVSNTRGRGPN
ncbi:zinc finger protein, putative [Rhizoctonia solani AG-3 Rhs1AP]|uniref:Zinc finger protein, putative n=1 Tax=Rhizoctonia solani AG-3 Rhs1AP TaxID=1086054 RepID=X8JSQ2_9AGAM|nr:zinc finger protein, putative [Rhizoctonia solani AG-3 Rhs1AP]